MIPASTPVHLLPDLNQDSLPASTVLYQARRNADGKIIDFQVAASNASAVAAWGWVQKEFVGKSIRQVVPETEAAFLISQFSLVIDFGRSVQFDMDARRQDHPMERRQTVLVSKQSYDVVRVTSDVVRAPALAQQADLMQTIMQNTACMIDILEAVRGDDGKIDDFVYRIVNPSGLAGSGSTAEQMIGQRFRTVHPDGVASGMFDHLVAVVETGETYQHEVNVRAGSGESWINARHIRYNDGVMTISFDLTASRVAEQEQKRQTELYKTILDTALTSISVLEAVREDDEGTNGSAKGKIVDFRYTLVNQERLRFAGQPESFFIGRKLTELYPGMVDAGVFDHWVQVVETRQPHQFDLHYTYDGFNEWTLCMGSPFGDGVIVSFADITERKRAELQARQYADLLASIQDTSQMGISAYTAIRNEAGEVIDFQTVFRNRASTAMFRQPADRASQTLLEMLPSLSQTDVWQRYIRVTETGQAEQFEQYHAVDTVEGWFDISVRPWGDGIVVHSLDTTEFRKAVRDKLHQSRLLQQVVDHTEVGLVLARPVRNAQDQIIDFVYVLTNECNARTTGLSVADMTGALMSEMFPGWQSSGMFQRYVDVVQTGQPQRLTFPCESSDEKGWFDGSFVCVDDCVLYTYTNVTSLKESELIQQQNAELLEQVMRMTPAAIVLNKSIRNEAGDIVDLRMIKLNQMAADLMQNSIDKIQYRRVSKYIPGSVNSPLFEQCKHVIETGQATRLEVPWANHWYDFSLARFGDGVVLTVQDITPMREYRQKLEQANIELRRSNENLQSFAFVSSHDLQEPLRKISSFTTILQTQYANLFGEEVTDIIHRINTSADRMRLLIQDLLAYSKLETRQDLFKPVDIAGLIQELQEHELWVALNQSHARIHLGELPTVIADPSQMRQLFQNLLSNAIKFCPVGAMPSISVSSRVVSRSEVQADLPYFTPGPNSKPNGQFFYEIAVTDNGIGFDEKYVDRIFQVFQRLHGRSQYAGSGIGLAICYKIVERHDGVIIANSRPGEGSTFRIYLPVR
jgi:signal transduction histidine kinase/PAS domain-containing protein